MIRKGKHLGPLRAVHNNAPDKPCDIRQRETPEMRKKKRKRQDVHACGQFISFKYMMFPSVVSCTNTVKGSVTVTLFGD